MRSLVRLIIVLFTLSLFATQLHSVIRYFYPGIATTKINMFFDRSYTREVTVQWYVFFLAQYMFVLVLLFCGCMIAIRVSFALTMVLFSAFVYWLVKLWCFGWNYDSNAGFDWMMVGCVVLSMICVVFPGRINKYKSLV